MSIKLLGGMAKGRTLLVPKGQLIRPTSVLLKRRVFDSIQDFSPYCFWDLCAGTGSVGLEAWSRGAQRVNLSEVNREVFKILKRNTEAVVKGLEPDEKERPIALGQKRVEKWFSSLASVGPIGHGSDIFFLDPPYEFHDLYKKVGLGLLERIDDSQQVWIESDKEKGLKLEFWLKEGHEPFKIFKQGGSYLALFAKR